MAKAYTTPLAYFDFNSASGATVPDITGGAPAYFYREEDDAAVPMTGGVAVATGAPTDGGAAAEMNGRSTFGYVANDPAFQVMNGTFTAWVRPDTTEGFQTILAKDQSGTDDGGHFRIALDDGRLYVRAAPGGIDEGNVAFRSLGTIANPGEWTHIAVSFGADGLAVYVNGERQPDIMFETVEGRDRLMSEHESAFLLSNTEPLIIGADTFRVEDTSSPDAIAEDGRLSKVFDGAIDGIGFWGGDTPDHGLDAEQVRELYQSGPAALVSLTPQSPPLPSLTPMVLQGTASAELMTGDAGHDIFHGGGGGDQLIGDYGNDQLYGGDGNDVLDGRHGLDVLSGGAGNDLLISQADAREPRIAQDYSNADDPYNQINRSTDTIYPDQPINGNDILVGGSGADTFRFITLLNAKREILLQHVNDDRTIDWSNGGVAGENDNVHDHWVDAIGMDTILDFNRAEGDRISIAGHTTKVLEVEHLDGDGDGQDDYSLIRLYSDQGAGGGAHDGDLLGIIKVHGDLVQKSDYSIDPKTNYGIVETIDELDEAIAPLIQPGGNETPGNIDALRYVAGYDDLIAAIGMNEEAALSHFTTHGLVEGRTASAFEAMEYVAGYDDLVGAYGLDTSSATAHFVGMGFGEGRLRDAFNNAEYVAAYDDLIDAIGPNAAMSAWHYVANGWAEGRSATAFSGLEYIASHVDLITALGADAEAGANHFIAFGRDEGRSRDEFDAVQYLNNYADLGAAFGTDTDAAATHFILHGFGEGRTDEALFDDADLAVA